jgi:tRNA(Ile)-lysidine synthase
MNLYSTIANGRTLETTHIEALRALAQKGIPHSAISLPEKIEGVIENGALCLRKKEDKPVVVEDYRIQLCNKETVILQTNAKIFIGNSHNEENVYKNSILLSIDFDKIEGELIARNRCTGDKIRMGGMNKSLKKLMCDKKIPLEERYRLPIICDDAGIVAIPFVGERDGCRIKKGSPLNENSLKIIFYLY